MIMAQVVFGVCKGTKEEREERYDEAIGYLASLRRNGQLNGKYLLGWYYDKLTAYVNLSDPKAIQKRNHSEYGLNDLKKIITLFGQIPQWTFLQRKEECQSATWHSASTLYLFTTFIDFTSPICHGETGEPIPTFTIPIEYKYREDIERWAASYRSIDEVQMQCGELEIPTYYSGPF